MKLFRAFLFWSCLQVNITAALVSTTGFCKMEQVIVSSGESRTCGMRSHVGQTNNNQIVFNEENDPLHIDEDKGSSNDLFNVRPSKGRGLGAFATQFIPRGTHILVEKALFRVPSPQLVPGKGYLISSMLESISSKVLALDYHQQNSFLELQDFRTTSDENESKYLTIFRNNAYNTGADQVGIFPKIARINHSCRPNAGNYWSVKQDERIIYSTRDIELGEEIFVSYIPLLKAGKERQKRLQQYGFTCDCAACRSGESDKRRGKIADLIDALQQNAQAGSLGKEATARLIKKSVKLVSMIEEESIIDYITSAYRFAAVFNQRGGQIIEARKWAEMELEMHRFVEADSDDALGVMEFLHELEKH